MVLIIAAERAPAEFIAELVDVVQRRLCPHDAEVLVGADTETGRLALYVAGTMAGGRARKHAGVRPPANPSKRRAPRAQVAAPSLRKARGSAPSMDEVLRALQSVDGELVDDGGRVVRRLAELLERPTDTKSLQQLTQVVKRMEDRELVARDNRGRRTFTYELALEPAGLALLDGHASNGESSATSGGG